MISITIEYHGIVRNKNRGTCNTLSQDIVVCLLLLLLLLRSPGWDFCHCYTESFFSVLGNCDSQTFVLEPNMAKLGCGGAAGCVTFDLSHAGRPAALDSCDLCMFAFFCYKAKLPAKVRGFSKYALASL